MGPNCDWRAYSLKEADKGTFFTCQSPSGEKTELFVPAAGEHNVRNALSAMAVARYLEIPAEDAVRAIAAYKAPAMRQQVIEANGLLIIDDSYNASPDSMRSAIDVLSTRQVPGRKAAVLADMLELGDFAHQATGRWGSTPAATAWNCWWLSVPFPKRLPRAMERALCGLKPTSRPLNI